VKDDVVIILGEDDEGHAALIRRNLERAGIRNSFLHFNDGELVLKFLHRDGESQRRRENTAYLLLLDIRMPKVDGVEVLRQIKQDPELRRMPVIMITTTDDPREVANCHHLGCNSYLTKPIDYDRFVESVRQLGLFLKVVEVPGIGGEEWN